MSQQFYETEAYRLYPEGCKCPSTDGGGDCDWCHVYYGKEPVESRDEVEPKKPATAKERR